MKTRSLFLWAIIAALWGMVTACEELNLPDTLSNKPNPDLPDSTTDGKGTVYTVSFETNGGSPAPQRQSISKDRKATEPAPMNKIGYGFAGWYKEAAFNNLWNFDNDTVTGNITLYAKWDSNYYTVTFEADGGDPLPQQQNIAYGSKAIKPQDMSKNGVDFEGWYKEVALNNLWNFNSDTVTENIVLYAKWGPPTIVQKDESTTLAQKLQWLSSNAVSNKTYILEVSNDEFLNPHALSYSGRSNIYIQLIGIGDVITIELYNYGSLFTVENNVTLSLNENIVLRGRTYNNNSLVMVSGGNLIMNNGSKIIGNWSAHYSSSSSYGGGVYVSDGTFIMNGGEISGNTISGSADPLSIYPSSFHGGGVYVSDGTFIMNGGKISGNTAVSYGGGVYVNNGTFIMNDGEISGNSSSCGGGVYVSDGIFTMIGGEISSNTSSSSLSGSNSRSYGGGVYVSDGIFTMTGGEISSNTSSSSLSGSNSFNSFYSYSYGGGVYVSGTFTMTGGEISGNSSSASNSASNSSPHSIYSYSYGGGVYVSGISTIGGYVSGTFTMTGGEISGNTATSSSSYNSGSQSVYSSSYGGGVYVNSDGSSIKKTGGIITGYSSDTINGNVVKNNNGNVQNNNGHAVYVANIDNYQFIRRKETTAGQGDNLIYISNNPAPPTISGVWDE